MPLMIEKPKWGEQHKRLIICCDGTWQASDNLKNNVESNVTKMCRTLSKEAKVKIGDKEEWVQQVVFYQSGIGTDALFNFARAIAGGTGAGLSKNIVQAYNFLCNNYERGDQIFLFGFSRGAYTARAIAGFVSDIGILRKRYMTHIPYLYELFHAGQDEREKLKDYIKELFNHGKGLAKEKDSKEETKAVKHLLESCGSLVREVLLECSNFKVEMEKKLDKRMVEIQIVGCWDTVGSLGVPDTPFIGNKFRELINTSYQLSNTDLSDRVNHAFHALSLDEHRRPFTPTLWHMKKEKNQRSELIQCWFPGVHINTGGGSSEDGCCDRCAILPKKDPHCKECDKIRKNSDRGQLADLTFAWMVDLCRPYLAFNEMSIEAFIASHYQTADRLRALRKASYPLNDREEVHKFPAWSDPVIGSFSDSFDDMPAGGSLIRTPGEYSHTPKKVTVVGSDDWIAERKEWATHEYIHPSVRLRLEQTERHWKAGKGTPWKVAIQQKALRHFQVQKWDSLESVVKNMIERCCTRPFVELGDNTEVQHIDHHYHKRRSALAWTKINPKKNPQSRLEADDVLVIPEWAISSSRFHELSPKGAKSLEERLIADVHNGDRRGNMEVWEKKVKLQVDNLGAMINSLPGRGADGNPLVEKVKAGSTILLKTTTNAVKRAVGGVKTLVTQTVSFGGRATKKVFSWVGFGKAKRD